MNKIFKKIGKKNFAVLCYFLFLFITFFIMTINEEMVTSVIIGGWYVVPMVLNYFFILKFNKKESTLFFFMIALINTLLVGVIMTVLGAYILTKSFEPY